MTYIPNIDEHTLRAQEESFERRCVYLLRRLGPKTSKLPVREGDSTISLFTLLAEHKEEEIRNEIYRACSELQFITDADLDLSSIKDGFQIRFVVNSHYVVDHYMTRLDPPATGDAVITRILELETQCSVEPITPTAKDLWKRINDAVLSAELNDTMVMSYVTQR